MKIYNKKSILLLIPLLFISFQKPLAGLEVKSMSDNERLIFRKEVRDYLLSNPEIILESIDLLKKRQARIEEESDQELVINNFDLILNDGYSYVGGAKDAQLTIVEFLDYQCGYCRQAHKDIKAILLDNNDLRYIIKEFPILGAKSLLSAKAASVILKQEGNRVYEKFSDKLMTHTGDINSSILKKIAKSVGSKVTNLETAIQTKEINSQIKKTNELARILKIQGTPTFIIGTQMIRGYIARDQLQQLIDKARKDL
jgi:protein-disulfide isomerase